MNKTFFLCLFAFTAVLLFVQQPSAEARHCRSTRVQLNVVSAYVGPETYVFRRYPQPVAVTPVYVASPPVYCGTPVYMYQQPIYVEEVYVARRPAPVIFPGLSFSWNFFR